MPHLRALLREGAVDVELHFGEPIEFAPATNRKEATRRVEARGAGDAAGRRCANPQRAAALTRSDDRLFFVAESR